MALKPHQGLYDPRHEHDACGVGFVANIKGRKSHEVIACGLPGVAMTSIADELEHGTTDLDRFRTRIGHHFCLAHGRRQRLVAQSELETGPLLVPA